MFCVVNIDQCTTKMACRVEIFFLYAQTSNCRSQAWYIEAYLPLINVGDWSFSFSISPSNEHPGPISFRMDWLDLLAVQVTLKNLPQHHSSKASIFRHSAFFTVQLSYPYMATGKTIALTRRTFVIKVMSLLFNMLSRLVITFLPRSKLF